MPPSTTRAAASLAEIDRLTDLAGAGDRPELDVELVRLRYELGRQLLDDAGSEHRRPRGLLPADDPFPGLTRGTPPEIDLGSLDVELLRGALVHHGCVVVHDFFPAEAIQRLRDDIDQLEIGFERWAASGHTVGVPPWFDPLDAPDAELPLAFRAGCGAIGTYYAADSPRGLRHLIEAFDEAGMRALATEYMGEEVLLALEKSALRHVPKSVPQAWHQDGFKFGVDVGLINVWVALCDCGVDVPGLGILPLRPTEILALHEASTVPWEIEPGALAAAAGEVELRTLDFRAGDAVLFDEMLVHSTIRSDAMTRRRYGADAWFFPPSAFPADLYRPLAYAVP